MRRIKLIKYLSIKELEQYILNSYAKVASNAENDGVYKPLAVIFNAEISCNQDGIFCYSDNTGYHLKVNEHGSQDTTITTQSLIEITYYALENDIFWMSFEFERQNRIAGQDSRRLMFDKMLQYWGAIDNELAEYEKEKIAETLRNNPFID